MPCFLLALSLALPAAGFGQTNPPEESLSSYADNLENLADKWQKQNEEILKSDEQIKNLQQEIQNSKNLTNAQKDLLQLQEKQLEERRLAALEARKHLEGLLKVCANLKLAKRASDLTWQIGIPVSFALGGVVVWLILKH